MRTRSSHSVLKSLAVTGAIALGAAALGGCLTDAPVSDPSATATDPTLETNAQQDQAQPQPSSRVPKGCALEWSQAAMDSVIYCPDIAPPKPR
jgi:hypothetical protein